MHMQSDYKKHNGPKSHLNWIAKPKISISVRLGTASFPLRSASATR